MIAWLFPGQGSQHRGMGADLFDKFAPMVSRADELLGYSVRDLCLADPDRRLGQTRYAQPALFVVNALSYLARAAERQRPQFLAGHSLGEYAALFAAGCFDLEQGLMLVRRRADIMAQARRGSMVAVLGLSPDRVVSVMSGHGMLEIDVANYNGPTQVVLSGPVAELSAASEVLEQEAGARCVPLNVSGAFHSRLMAEPAMEFEAELRRVTFRDPDIPVISNVTGRPYPPGAVADLLADQMRSPVRWWASMRYLRDRRVEAVEELGPKGVLEKLWTASHASDAPAGADADGGHPRDALPGREMPATRPSGGRGRDDRPLIGPDDLGSERFRRDYGLRYAYLAGSMFKGIASVDLVVRMANSGLMGFFGAGGLRLDRLDAAIRDIRRGIGPAAERRFGMNLLNPLNDPALEAGTVELYLRHDVRFVEAAAYTEVTAPLVHFRAAGSRRDSRGRPVAVRHVVAKVSRPEVAAAFMRPPSREILDRLVQDGRLTPFEAEIASELPVSQDVCVESDSGGHTDGGVALALIPSMLGLRDELMARHRYEERIRVGAAGGIGAPEAVAAAFVLGADFIVTGSVNQCSPEAGTSPAVKDILATMDVQDTVHAPAGDMFEIGAKVQVARKGTLFPGRANKLYQLYRQHEALEEIDVATRRTIQETYFKRSFQDVWRDTAAYLADTNPGQLERAERSGKYKMGLMFRWYFTYSNNVAIQGDTNERVNYQIQCGPAMGAFNRFVKGSDIEGWHQRHVDVIAEVLMEQGAARLAACVTGQRRRSDPVQLPTNAMSGGDTTRAFVAAQS